MPKNDSEKSLLMSCMINANINLYIIAWPLRKDDTHIREAFHIFFLDVRSGPVSGLLWKTINHTICDSNWVFFCIF